MTACRVGRRDGRGRETALAAPVVAAARPSCRRYKSVGLILPFLLSFSFFSSLLSPPFLFLFLFLFLVFDRARSTTHATQLFRDVTRHVSRTHVYPCKHVSRFAAARDAFVDIFTAIHAWKERGCCTARCKPRNARQFLLPFVLVAR